MNRRQFMQQGFFSLLGSRHLFAKLEGQSLSLLPPSISFIWLGALSGTSVRAKVRLDTTTTTAVRFLVSTTAALDAPIYSAVDNAQTSNNFVADLTIDTLQPDTTYYTAVEVDGVVDSSQMITFHTPAVGPYTFQFACSACAHQQTQFDVFTTIRNHNPLFFLHLGDLHYHNINVNDIDIYRTAYDEIFDSSTTSQGNLYRHIPLVYTWDDHDYGENNSDRTSPSKQAACQTYREYVPHYPLADAAADAPIYHAFTIGRVRFVICDSRAERSPYTWATDPDATMLGDTQKAWFKQELTNARDNGQFVIFTSGSPWLGEPEGGNPNNDTWYGYSVEREELADFIEGLGMNGRVLALCSDAHMLGIDDGTHNTFASSGAAGFPIFQVGPLSSLPSFKGGTYSHGTHFERGQYGLITITDGGSDTIEISLSGRWSGPDNGYADDEVVSYTFTATIGVPTAVTELHTAADSNPSTSNDLLAATAAVGLAAATGAAVYHQLTNETDQEDGVPG